MNAFVAPSSRKVRPAATHNVAEGYLWGGAAVVALLAHVAAGAAAMSLSSQVAPGAPEVAIMIDLAPEVSAPETSEVDLEQGPPQIETPEAEIEPEPIEEPEPEPEPAEPPPPEPEPVVEEEPEPEEDPEEVIEPEPVVEQAAVPMPVVRPPVPRRIEPPRPPRREQVRRERPPRQVNRPPARVTTAPPAATRQGAAAAPQVMGNPSRDRATWQSRLAAHLQRNKPRGGQHSGSGTVYVTLVIDPAGRIISHRIARGSGQPSIDGQIGPMMQRANPVPAPPASIARPRMTFTVPVRFK